MNITTLGLAVDSSSIKQAAAALDAMAVSGDKAERTAAKLGKSSDAYTNQLNAIYRASKANRQVQVELNAEQEKFISGLQRQVDTVGLSKSKLLEFRAQELGVANQAKLLIVQLDNATAAMKKHGAGAHDAGGALEGFSLKSAQAKRELVVIGRELSRGDFTRAASSFSLFAQASGLVAVALSPVGASITAVTAALSSLGIAYEVGESQSAAFARSITLTGNYAGITEGQYNALATSIAKSANASIGSSREITQALIASGRFSGEALTATAKGVLLMSRVTGESTDKVVKDYVGMSDGVVRFAEKANSSYNFLNASQLEHIRTLEDEGDKQKAIIDLMGALNIRLESAATNVGALERAWRAVRKEASSAIDAMLSIGRAKTQEDTVALLKSQIAALDTRKSNNPERTAQIRALLVEQLEAAKKVTEQTVAQNALKVEGIERDKAGIAFAKLKEQSLSRQEKLTRELSIANALADKSGATAAERKQVIDDIKLKYKPAKTVDTSRQEGRAQLSLDLEDIRRSSEAIQNTYDNAQRIVESKRSQSLLNEAEHYAARRGLASLFSTEQERSLKAEIARMEAQKFSGQNAVADELNNKRQIAEATAKLAKVRENAGAASVLLADQETESAARIAQAYRSANDAAQDYIDGLRRSQQLEINSLGLGSSERGRLSGRAQIQDKYDQQTRANERFKRDALATNTFGSGSDAEKKYTDELDRIRKFQAEALELYDKGFKDRMDAQGDWLAGAKEGLIDYYNSTRDIYAQTAQTVSDSLHGVEDSLTKLFTTGKGGFKDLASSIIADLVRIQVRQSITGPASQSLTGSIGSLLSGIFGGTSLHAANGGTFGPNSLVEVNERGPELLTVGSRQYLMTGTQGGTVTPNGGGGGGGGDTYNFGPVGDVSSKSFVVQALQGAKRQAFGASQRSKQYGGGE